MNPVKTAIEQLDLIIKNVELALDIPEKDVPPQQTCKEATEHSKPASVPSTFVAFPVSEGPQDDGTLTEESKKKKKEKKAKQPKAPAAPTMPLEVSQFLQCDLRVGYITEVALHPEASGLYVLQIAFGDMGTRTVCAGLRNFLSEDEIRSRKVVTICNLKPRKLRGVDSEAMILAGSTLSGDGGKETVVPLTPPSDATEGDVISVSNINSERSVAEGKFMSGKVWDKVVSRLSVSNGYACYDGSSLVVGNQPVSCDLPNGSEIH